MTNVSHLQRKSRPWIAMIAAYAIALQMLLTAAVASQNTAAPTGVFSICFGSGIDGQAPGQGDPVLLHQDACVLCCAGCSGSLAGAVATAPTVNVANGVVLAVHPHDLCLVPALPTPRLSQGPPSAM